MATTKKGASTTAPKKTLAQYRKENEKLSEELEKIKGGAYCYMCNAHKSRDKFHVNTNPLIKSGLSPICKNCAKNIACRIDKNGDLHEPTRESLIMSLKYIDKPFLETVYNASIQESENLIKGNLKTNFAMAYFKNIQMVQYMGLTYEDSDFFKEKIIYDDEKKVDFKNKNDDSHEQYIKDKSDVIRLIHYDPFEKELIEDQPFLYSQLLGLLDTSEDANEDMMRTASAISIVRAFLQQSKTDNVIANLMCDIKNMERNAATIKSLQDSKQKLTSIITNLAAESCISLKNSKNAKKGENTWTGKIKKIKELNLREGEVNGFDIGTCRGMQQVMDLSNASILRQLRLDESDYSDMLADQREMMTKLQQDLQSYKEISRILLRENLDLKDYLEENNMLNRENLVDLEKLYSCFSEINEGDEDGK
ncbi:hypothetical protein [Clostridium sp.]|uniref:hypothetical protein n=1 Tax=Clostridium sp. TaxID=1506 RepID=UPI00321808E8